MRRPSLQPTPRAARPPRVRGRTAGFTLLEVMVALGILASALVAVSGIVSAGLRNHVRARDLEVATLLARGKMAELEDRFEAKGFRTFDEKEEGTFEEEGHPEIRWELAVTMPSVELGADQVIGVLTGSTDGLEGLLGEAGPEQAQALGPLQGLLKTALQNVATAIGEQLKKGVRDVALTVSWPEGGAVERLTVRTQMVVLAPGEEGPQ